MTNRYQMQDELNALNQWLVLMRSLKNIKFQNSYDLMKYFKSSFNDIKKFNTSLIDLIENEKIINFINAILNISNENPLFQNYLSKYSSQSIIELQQIKNKVKKREELEKIRKEKERLLEEMKKRRKNKKGKSKKWRRKMKENELKWKIIGE